MKALVNKDKIASYQSGISDDELKAFQYNQDQVEFIGTKFDKNAMFKKGKELFIFRIKDVANIEMENGAEAFLVIACK